MEETSNDTLRMLTVSIVEDDESIETRARANGADGFFHKPLELDNMLDCIQRVLERSSSSRAPTL